jgi:peptide/nickel transport system permease protein
MSGHDAVPEDGRRYLNSDRWKALHPLFREARYRMHRLKMSPPALIGLGIIIFMFMIALLAPLLAPAVSSDPSIIPFNLRSPIPPGHEGYVMGTGKAGIDIFYGVVWGAKTSIYVSLSVVGTAALIGLVLGSVSGYRGGTIDDLLMRITDVFLSIPSLIMAMAITAVFARSLEFVMLALMMVWWPSYARLVRGQVLSIKENSYVEAARAIGAKGGRILFRHIVPNSLSPLLVSVTLDIGAVVLTTAGLGFLGFGAASGTAEWGSMVADGQQYFFSTVIYEGEAYNPWWIWVFPGGMIFLFVMGFNLLGDGLRDVLDPRQRR